MGKSILIVKVDKTIEKRAKQLAKAAGLTLSQLVDQQLARAVAAHPTRLDSPSEIRPEVADYLKKASADAVAGRNTQGPFKAADEVIQALYKKDGILSSTWRR